MHAPETFSDKRAPLPGDVEPMLRDRGARVRPWALGGLGLLALGALFDPTQAMRSYLVAYFIVLSFGLGSLALILLHNTTGGVWGDAIRRPLESAVATLPILGLAFLPIFLGMGYLYSWADPATVASDPLLIHKAPYLNVAGWRIRAVVYWLVWLLVAHGVRGTAALDGANDLYPTRRQRVLGGFGLALYCVTMTFAAIDWGMALEPHWFSTLYGVIFLVGQVLSTLCLAVFVTAWLLKRKPVIEAVGPTQLHDLGNLMFAFVMLWGYMAFSQFLIIWSANLAEEAPWYLARSHGGWQWIAGSLALLHFLVPFAVLLGRKTKRTPERLALVAAWLLVMRVVDAFWLITPAFFPGHFHLSIFDFFAVLGLAALWLRFFLNRLAARPLVYRPAPRETAPAPAPALTQ